MQFCTAVSAQCHDRISSQFLMRSWEGTKEEQRVYECTCLKVCKLDINFLQILLSVTFALNVNLCTGLSAEHGRSQHMRKHLEVAWCAHLIPGVPNAAFLLISQFVFSFRWKSKASMTLQVNLY